MLGFGIMAFIDFLIIAFILYMESLFFCLTLLLGQVLLVAAIGASAGFIYLVGSGLSKIIRWLLLFIEFNDSLLSSWTYYTIDLVERGT